MKMGGHSIGADKTVYPILSKDGPYLKNAGNLRVGARHCELRARETKECVCLRGSEREGKECRPHLSKAGRAMREQ